MVMIAKKKPTKRGEPISPKVKAKVSERGTPIGRKVVRPPRPPRGKPRDAMSKILMAPKQSGPPRTKDRTKPKSPKKTIGSLMSEGMSKGMATNAMKKAAMKLAKRGKPSGRPKRKFGPITPKRGKPKFMKK